MKQNKGPLIFLTIITIFIFKNNQLIQSSILESCQLFITKLFPSLFPMMIVTDCFLFFGLPEYLAKYFGNIFQKIFHISPYGAFAFFISCFSGSPSNVYVMKNLYLQQYLSKEETEKLLSFAFFSNPLFLYTMLSLIFPNQPLIVLKLIIIPYFVNIIIGISEKKNSFHNKELIHIQKRNFGNYLTESIKNAMNTQMLILGSVTIFFLLNKLLNPLQYPIISGILEISQGLNCLINWSVSLKIKELIAMIFISFGGLSIHLQIKGILSESDISYWNFFKGRLKQTILSSCIILIL